jgi:SAM-dependent methyltransferase
VLCTQVLEHLPEPGAAISEIHRVLRTGGVGLISTHGVHVFHPDPPGSGQDYWRWTHAGLEKLFRDTSPWSRIEVEAQGDVITCVATLFLWYLDGAMSHRLLQPARRALVAAVNVVAHFLDARYPATLRVPAPGSLTANYLLTATK